MTSETDSWQSQPPAPGHHPGPAPDWFTPRAVPATGGPARHRAAAPAPEPEPEVELAPYSIPVVPATGWDPAPSPRRRWISRALLAGVLAIQAALSLRLRGAAHPDEALAMILGRQQLDHLLHDGPAVAGLASHQPGVTWLYPPMAGAAADAGGIFAVRSLSLVFALITTALLYSLTRRLFNERAAICGTAAYAVLQSTVVVGFYAAPEALAVMLLALTGWVLVVTRRTHVASVLLAVPTMALAAAASFVAVLALPVLATLALATAWPHRGRTQSVLRALLLAAASLGVLAALGTLPDLWAWMSSPERGTHPSGRILLSALQWSGLFTAFAVAGAFAYVYRERMNESTEDAVTASRLRRTVISACLVAGALVVPLLHAWFHNASGMFRYLGFGMLLAAPLAGVGINRLVGAHFRHPQLGILVWVALLALGLDQAALRYQNGPDSGRLLGVIATHAGPQGRFLTEVTGLPQYYLGEVTKPEQWFTPAAGPPYKDAAGAEHRGLDGTLAAVRDGWFTIVLLDSTAPAATDRAIGSAVTESGKYRLVAQFNATAVDSATYRVYVLS